MIIIIIKPFCSKCLCLLFTICHTLCEICLLSKLIFSPTILFLGQNTHSFITFQASVRLCDLTQLLSSYNWAPVLEVCWIVSRSGKALRYLEWSGRCSKVPIWIQFRLVTMVLWVNQEFMGGTLCFRVHGSIEVNKISTQIIVSKEKELKFFWKIKKSNPHSDLLSLY